MGTGVFNAWGRGGGRGVTLLNHYRKRDKLRQYGTLWPNTDFNLYFEKSEKRSLLRWQLTFP